MKVLEAEIVTDLPAVRAVNDKLAKISSIVDQHLAGLSCVYGVLVATKDLHDAATIIFDAQRMGIEAALRLETLKREQLITAIAVYEFEERRRSDAVEAEKQRLAAIEVAKRYEAQERDRQRRVDREDEEARRAELPQRTPEQERLFAWARVTATESAMGLSTPTQDNPYYAYARKVYLIKVHLAIEDAITFVAAALYEAMQFHPFTYEQGMRHVLGVELAEKAESEKHKELREEKERQFQLERIAADERARNIFLSGDLEHDET